MDGLSLILGLIVAGLCVLFVAWPFIRLSKRPDIVPEPIDATDLEVLVEQRAVIYDTIRDLDFDYETGKLLEGDYRQQRGVWVGRGVEILKAIDTLQQQAGQITPVGEMYPVEVDLPTEEEAEPLDLDAQIEAAVASRRRA